MKGSLLLLGIFAAGCLCGWSGILPEFLAGEQATRAVLFLLMLLVGLSIGSDPRLREILRSLRPDILLVPLATWTGTLTFAALTALILPWSLGECLALGSGFAYYSLSSILITELRTPAIGAEMAARLGTIALLCNILREMFVLIGAPLLRRRFGPLAPICAGGATTMDSTLPVITAACGQGLVFVSIIHGMLVDFSVPLLVSLFCAIS